MSSTQEIVVRERVSFKDIMKWRKELCRLKCNWFFVILISSLGSINTSSPLGTLHQFITNPLQDEVKSAMYSAKYEPGLGGSESIYAWSISVNNIGGFFGAILGGLLSHLIPYWYSFLISLFFHILGFLLYGLAKHGWMIILSRLLTGVFNGLQRTLAFAYFGESYQHYVETLQSAGKKESDKLCRVKDVLFTLFTVSTGIGLLLGAGFSAVIARIDNIDHFRAVGWYNLGFGVLSLVLLLFFFRGECTYKKLLSPIKNIQDLVVTRTQLKERFNISSFLTVTFLILCTAIVKSRISVYEGLFNPILSDSFGFSEDVTVYFFLIILISPLLGGLLLLILEWTKITNLMISIIGVITTIMGLLIMIDWQAIPHDPCTQYSVFHHPELMKNYSVVVQTEDHLPKDLCWSLDKTFNVSGVPFSYGKVQVVLDTDVEPPSRELIECQSKFLEESCLGCSIPSESLTALVFGIYSEKMCFEPIWQPSKKLYDDSLISVVCQVQNSSSCFSICLEFQNGDTVESFEPNLIRQTSKSLVEVAYAQTVQVLDDSQYHIAKNVCESHKESNCHWIPDSLVINEHCVDCPPICRAVDHTLNFIQFVIGGLWFMFTVPIAEVSLPIVISDSVGQDFQGIVMGITVASTELLQGVTPLWLTAAYEACQKRTFLPLLTLIATCLPFLLGLILLYLFQVRLFRNKHKNEKDVLEAQESRHNLLQSKESNPMENEILSDDD